MKKGSFILILVFVPFLYNCNTKKEQTKDPEPPSKEASYFGQELPDSIPKLFAPGLVSLEGRYEHGISFSPDLEEMYFAANEKDQDPDIYFSRLEGETWTPIQKANFTQGEKSGEMHPFVSLSNDKIYFTAHNADLTDTKIWYANRVGNSWDTPKKIDSPINEDEVFYSNAGKNGDLFYFNVSRRKMYYAPNKNGKFPEVREMEIEFGVHGFIAPSGAYMVVNARNKEDDQRKDSDIYVYFKKKDSTWTKAINLGNEVNTTYPETCPSVTPDGNYLFFGRYNEEGGLSNFYWVSTTVINKVKPVNL